MPQKNKISLKVGFTIFAGLIILMMFVTAVGSESNLFSRTYTIKFFVKDIEGLASGSMVTLGGLKIGQVKEFEFTSENNKNGIIVILSLKKDYQNLITNKSKAVIKSLGMLGDKYVDITIGEPGDILLCENQFINVESSFSLENSVKNIESKLDNTFYNIDTVLGELKSVSVKLNDGNSTFGKLLTSSELYDNLNNISVKLNRISSDIIGQKGTLGKTIYDRELYDNLQLSTENIKTLTNGLNEGKGSLGKILVTDSLYNDIKSLSARLDKMLEKANGNSTIGNILNNADMYKEIMIMIENLNSFMIDLKKNPERYINLSIF